MKTTFTLVYKIDPQTQYENYDELTETVLTDTQILDIVPQLIKDESGLDSVLLYVSSDDEFETEEFAFSVDGELTPKQESNLINIAELTFEMTQAHYERISKE